MTARELPPLPPDPAVAVIVPARDSATTLADALTAVLEQGPLVREVVVAVGPSNDDTARVAADVAATDPRVRVIDNPSGGTADALNAAIEASRAPVLVRVDAHALIPAGYVERAVEVLRRTGAANVGGAQVPIATDGFARGVAAAMRSPAGSGGAAYRSDGPEGPADTVYLGAFRREALEHVGGFDARFIRNQDAELNLRLRRAGFDVWFDPELRVAYVPRGSVRALASQYFQYGRWRRLTARVHPGSLAPRQLAAPAIVVGLLGASATSVAVRDARPFGVIVGGYVVGLITAGVATGRSGGVLRTALALGVMHLSWGVGFLMGPPRADRRPPSPRRPSVGNHG